MFDVAPYVAGIPAFYFFYHVQTPAAEKCTPKSAGLRVDESRMPYKKTPRQPPSHTEPAFTHTRHPSIVVSEAALLTACVGVLVCVVQPSPRTMTITTSNE